MKNFKAYAMPCTEGQFKKDIEPTLMRWGIKYETTSDVIDGYYLVNNYNDNNREVGFTTRRIRREIIPYNPKLFLSSLFPEKWAVADTKESRLFLQSLQEKCLIDTKYFGFSSVNGIYGNWMYLRGKNYDLVSFANFPTDYTEVTLEDLIAHYEPTYPKWMPLTSKDCSIEEVIEFYNHSIVKLVGVPIPIIFNDKGSSFYVDYGNLIPYNPRIAELEQEISSKRSELEKLEEQLKELKELKE